MYLMATFIVYAKMITFEGNVEFTYFSGEKVHEKWS